MIPLPSIIVIDFCEWLSKRISTNNQEIDIFDLIHNYNCSYLLNKYAGEYLHEEGILVRQLLHSFIDSEEFVELVHFVYPPIWLEEFRHYPRVMHRLSFLFCGPERHRALEAYDRFLERISDSNELLEIEGQVTPERLADSARYMLDNRESRENYHFMLFLQTAVGDLSLEVDFLDWLLISKSKPIDLQRMPLDVFEKLVDEFFANEDRAPSGRKRLVKAFKQSDPISLAAKLSTFLTKSQEKKMKSLGYLYDRYSSSKIPYRSLFLPLAADADSFKTFINKYWEDLNELSSNYLDIYYSEAELKKSGYETRQLIKAIPKHLPNDLPCILIWADKMETARMIDIKDLSPDEIFRLISRIVDMIKQGQTLDQIVERATGLVKEFIEHGRPILKQEFHASDHAQLNVAMDQATLNATQNNTINMDKLSDLLATVRATIPSDMSVGDRETVTECLEVIENESSQEKPKKSLLKTALTTLKVIRSTAEFGATVMALFQFFQPLFLK